MSFLSVRTLWIISVRIVFNISNAWYKTSEKRYNIMKFICSKMILNNIVNVVQKSIGTKNVHPILECIKLEARADNTVTFTTNSVDVCIEYTSAIEVDVPGTAALPAKIFGEIVRRLPEGAITVCVDMTNYVTDIECGRSKFTIQSMNPEEFPAPQAVSEDYKAELKQRELKQIIRKVTPFISQSESRKPVLMGALFDFRGDTLNVVGSDLHRLAVIKTKVENNTVDNKFVIPGSTLAKIAQLLSDDEEAVVNIVVSKNNILFDFGEYRFYSRLLEGEFIKYDIIISAPNPIKVRSEKQAIINSLERANLIINDDFSSKTDNKLPVRLNINLGKIDISCKTGKGCVNDTVEVEHDGGDITIGFNCRFILDALNACDQDTVLMEFSAPKSGCFIKPEDGSDSYTFMVLPVKLYN